MADDRQQQLLPAQQQLDILPRWLRWSGLPQVLGPTAWAIYQALVMTDHQTMGLPSRRHYDGLAFEVTQGELEQVTGFCERTVRRQVGDLFARGLLEAYRESRAGKPGWVQIDREILRHLYRYVGPILRPEHQGLRGYDLHRNAEGGYLIYGFPTRHPLVLDWHDLWVAQKTVENRLPERPLIEHIRLIVENYVEKLADRESASDEAGGQRVRQWRTESPPADEPADRESASLADRESATMENSAVEQVQQEQP